MCYKLLVHAQIPPSCMQNYDFVFNLKYRIHYHDVIKINYPIKMMYLHTIHNLNN